MIGVDRVTQASNYWRCVAYIVGATYAGPTSYNYAVIEIHLVLFIKAITALNKVGFSVDAECFRFARYELSLERTNSNIAFVSCASARRGKDQAIAPVKL